MKPTCSRPAGTCSVIDEVDVDLDTIAGRGCTYDGADALCGAATTADHPAEIARTDLDLQLQAALGWDALDANGLGVVDDGGDDVRQHRGRGGRGQLGAAVFDDAHLAAARAA